jgi:hypothetical protein
MEPAERDTQDMNCGLEETDVGGIDTSDDGTENIPRFARKEAAQSANFNVAVLDV